MDMRLRAFSRSSSTSHTCLAVDFAILDECVADITRRDTGSWQCVADEAMHASQSLLAWQLRKYGRVQTGKAKDAR